MNKAVEITGLGFKYHDGTPALHDIDLEISEGESIGLIGLNGAGKSTLLLHLNGILTGSGTIRIFGEEIKEKNIKKIRSLVGLVFQDPDNQLFMPTVHEDVAFGPLNMGIKGEELKAKVSKALAEVGLTGFEKRSSHHLSFGEKKRLSIATVLSMNPKLLALDEPSSNLDPRHRRQLIDLLKSMKQTKIIATHDIDLVIESCNRVILMENGGIKAIFDTDHLKNNRNMLE